MNPPRLLHAKRFLSHKSGRSRWTLPPCRYHSQVANPSISTHDAAGRLADEKFPGKPFYVTTPIFYVNAAPHVGNLYTMVLGDIIKRWRQLHEQKAVLVTGTDEHGMKIQQAATKAGSLPKPFCDKGASTFKLLADKAEVSCDRFIRTTDADHEEAVREVWRALRRQDLIYSRKHEGWYSVSDETFYPDSAVHLVIEPATGRKIMASIETGKEVEWTSEVNYHFRLSAFRDRLLDFYKTNPTWITPEHRMKEVIKWVETGLEDLSISRPVERLSWGIKVPDDQTQTVYVWIDALINYITAAGYPWQSLTEFGNWPADVHIIGKDIMRFHCIYWPALLMALDLPLPRRIVAHSHWLMGRRKMSKSAGVVVNPFFAIDRFGADVLRFFLAHDGDLSADSEYDNRLLCERYNKSLKNSLGNLYTRLLRSKKWSVRGAIEAAHAGGKLVGDTARYEDVTMWRVLEAAPRQVEAFMSEYQTRKALLAIFDIIYQTNAYFANAKPWDLTGTQLDTVVFICAEALRITGILLQPYMPGKAGALLDMLGVEQTMRSFRHAAAGADSLYGVSKLDLGSGYQGTLFPPIVDE